MLPMGSMTLLRRRRKELTRVSSMLKNYQFTHENAPKMTLRRLEKISKAKRKSPAATVLSP